MGQEKETDVEAKSEREYHGGRERGRRKNMNETEHEAIP